METYKTEGTCSRQILFDVQNNKITHCQFVGGCAGNTKGIEKLVIGQNIEDVIEKLEGIKCRNNTSCTEQLAKALKKYKQK